MVYVYPKKIAKFINNISQRVQYEASILSLTFILLGLLFFLFYIPIATDLSLPLKIGTAFNTFFGIILLGSHLATVMQQYITYLQVVNILNEDLDYTKTKKTEQEAVDEALQKAIDANTLNDDKEVEDAKEKEN